MPLIKIGFKQNLILVIILTVFGFAFLLYMSISSLHNQTLASEKVDLLGSWVISLSNIKADVSIASRINDADEIPQLKSLLDRKVEVLEKLKNEGMKEAGNLEIIITDWVEGHIKTLALADQIGTSNSEGQRDLVTQELKKLENDSYSFMRQNLRSLTDSIYQVIEQRSAESIGIYKESMAEMHSSLEKQDFLKLFIQNLTAIDQETQRLIELISQERLWKVQNDSQLEALRTQVESNLKRVLEELSSARLSAEETSNTARMTILIAGILVTAICMLLLLFTMRRSTHSLSATLGSLEKISAGDLSVRMVVGAGPQDEFDRLGSAVNHSTESLGNVLNSVKGSSEQLQHMSSELSNTMKLQIRESEQTESETSTVAASVEEISQTVANMAQASEETNRLSIEALTATENGGVVITDALGLLEQLSYLFNDIHTQLNGLSSASARVDNVTGIIDGLAEQTNLLALNAAIEAARAGEAGRGFSVVADEVRALAEKTVSATANINGIVTDMQHQMKKILGSMENGQSQVSDSRDRGDKAINEMNLIRQLFVQVSERNQQQAVSIEEIASTTHSIAESMNAVLKNVSQGSERNREVGEFSTSVVGHAEKLLGLTEKFRC